MTDWPRKVALRNGAELRIQPEAAGVSIDVWERPRPLDARNTPTVQASGLGVAAAVFAALDAYGRTRWVGEVTAYIRSTSWGSQLP